jgi:hypothetical protein
MAETVLPDVADPVRAVPPRPPFWSRWWIYQRERFPLLAHGLIVAAFSSSAVCFSMMVRGAVGPPRPFTLLVAFATALLFFLQLRIADEFKDADEDARYRPYRPVPRGLIRLSELGILGVITGVVQLLLGLALLPQLVLLLLVVWVYLALMSKEFFVGAWLKKHPILYMVSHMVIIPQIDFYATACDWWPALGAMPPGLGWFVAVSYFNGVVFEVGRKIRAPADEEEGVDTYTALWGRPVGVLVWLGALVASGGCGLMAAARVGFLVPVVCLLVVLLGTAALAAWRFLKHPLPGSGKVIEKVSGVWILLLNLGVGTVPLLWRWGTASE